MQQFDPTKFVMSVGNIVVNSGMVKGSYINVATNEDAFKMASGVNSVVLVKLTDYTAVATLTMMQNSAINDVLSDWHSANVRRDAIVTTKPFAVADLLGTTVGEAPNAIISKTPDLVRASDDASQVEWMLLLDDWRVYHGGANL